MNNTGKGIIVEAVRNTDVDITKTRRKSLEDIQININGGSFVVKANKDFKS